MKKFPFIQAQFVASAFDFKSFPKLMTLGGNPMPEIALVGRSNVGKSSLINHLLKNSTLAKTSSTPGKTQSINFFSIDQRLALLDFPGYGYAKVSKEIRQGWSDNIDHYLQHCPMLKLILCLIDSRRQPTEEDLAFVKWAAFHQKPMLFIFTKADKMTEQQKKQATLASLDLLQTFVHASPAHFLHYSIKHPHARMELIAKINTLLEIHGTDQ